MGFFSSNRTKSYYAKQIAIEQSNLAQLKAGLVALKANHGGIFNNTTAIASQKFRIEQKKGYIASLKAEMKAAPKG